MTRIGSHTLLMAYSHVGHDCLIGDHAMLVNAATLAGHVTVEEWAVIGALCPVHQFVRIGGPRLHRRRDRRHQGRASLCQMRLSQAHPNLRPECCGTRAAWIYPGADSQNPSRLPCVAQLPAQHHAGSGKAALGRRPRRGCRDAAPLYRRIRARDRQVRTAAQSLNPSTRLLVPRRAIDFRVSIINLGFPWVTPGNCGNSGDLGRGFPFHVIR